MFLKNKKIFISIFFLLIFYYVGLKLISLYSEKSLNYKNIKNLKINFSLNKLDRVAHAGGGYNNQTYTNSIEALNFNKNKFNLFEIDFYLNKNDQLICTHNAEDQFIDLNKFIKKYKYTPCTLETLNKWLINNPNKKIVTDVKTNNLKALKKIKKEIADFDEKFIPQIYYPKEYEDVKNLGYKKIIWTLYRLDGNQKDLNYILTNLKKMDIFSVTMPERFVLQGYANEISEININTYVHTINTKKRYFLYKYFLGVDNIYTDWLN